MRKSQVISLIVLFIMTVLFIVIGYGGEDGDITAKLPTGSIKNTSSLSTPEVTPESTLPAQTATPTGVATAVIVPTPSPTVPSVVVTKPKVNYTALTGLNTKAYNFSFSSKLENANDTESRVVTAQTDLLPFLTNREYIVSKPSDTSKVVYITFNEAYETTGITPKLLDILKSKNAKATFFVTNEYINDNTGIVNRIVNEGHTLGTRGDVAVTTNGNRGMTYVSTDKFAEILWSLEEKYMSLFGNTKRMKFYRPDSFSERDIVLANQLGYTVVFRTYNYADWNEDLGNTKALANLKTQTFNGAVLQLSASKINANILSDYLDFLSQKGYKALGL